MVSGLLLERMANGSLEMRDIVGHEVARSLNFVYDQRGSTGLSSGEYAGSHS